MMRIEISVSRLVIELISIVAASVLFKAILIFEALYFA